MSDWTVDLMLGDCLEMMGEIEDGSVDSVVTDPPYGLSFMGKKWDYDVPSEAVWRECLRVLKPGGHLLAFAGTRTQHRMAGRIEDAGFEIRDMIAWVYGSGFPKSKNLDGGWQGWGTALKPALEPITVARKPLSGTVAANVLVHGTGVLNIDGCRVPVDAISDASQLRTMERGQRVSDTNDQTWGMSKGGGDTPQVVRPDGRWPANLIHDGSDEVVALFPDSKEQQGDVRGTEPSRTGGAGTNCYGEDGRVPTPSRNDGGGSAARFFYCAKTSRKDRDEGLAALPDREWRHEGAAIPQRADRPFVPSKNNHPTVKPTDLMRYLCRLVTPPGGIVLDPFMGSGSTGKAAMLEGFRFIGIERDENYFNIAEKRIMEAREAEK
jgi:hypothetical protein